MAIALALAALSAAWDSGPPSLDPPLTSADRSEGRERLIGAWLRESTQDGVRTQRILTLEADGDFREVARVVDPQGTSSDHAHQGTWLFDGANLKRKYTLIDGKPPSRLRVPFATFEITFDTRNEFTGVDHIHGNRIRYTRVAPETRLE
ncbi:MAG TPA: hypothetical protein VLJ86_18440 [Ramlibacter sp.]|nr:hypothetical protein [Ramlibacter sp.]